MADHPIFADDMQEIVESFVVETHEIFEELGNDLLELERRPDDQALIDQIFRAVHTVKGTSGFLSLEQLSDLAHHFEDVLNKMRRSEIDFHPSMMDVMLEAFDYMKVLLQQVVDRALTPLDLDDVVQALQRIADGGGEAASVQVTETRPPEAVSPQPDSEETAQPEPHDADEDEDTPALTVAEAEGRAAEEGAAEAPATADAAGVTEESEEADDEEETATLQKVETSAARQKGGSRRSRPTETIRVEVERLDNLMDLVGELVLSRNRLLQLVSDMQVAQDTDELLRELIDTNAQVDFITTELQTAVMHTRMVQIGRVFNKFPRLVRDLAKEFDKQIELVIEGEETELDKSLVEEIGDPLVHLIRNSADHGIEQPEERVAAGKPAKGRIRLAASHEGNHIVIEIEDDGRGLDVEAIKNKAVEKNIITPKEASEMSDSEAIQLIFRPGFSTAKRVSQVSGRGVGMDVVKTNITRLNGTINIASEPGKGTRFTLKLPLTLAIIQSLLVRVGSETFAIPLHSVIEVVGLDSSNVSTIQGREVIHIREQVLPLVRVADALNLNIDLENDRRAYAVIVGIAHRRLGLVVDGLTGQKEIVIKPLGNYLKKVAGIAGSTILGDGRVIMILDVAELVRMEQEKRRGKVERHTEAA